MLGYGIAFVAALIVFIAIAYIMYRHYGAVKSIRLASEQLELRDELLQAVNDAAVILLNADLDNFSEDLFNAMGVIAVTVKVDRVYIWKNHLISNELHCTQLYEWSEGASPQQGLDITIDISYKDNIPEWEKTLSKGDCINSIVRLMSPESQMQLGPQGIISIMVVPIFLNEKFWGFVGFDDCHRERVFTKEEETILRSCSLLFAHAYQRNEMIDDIRYTSARLEVALDEANSASIAKGNFLSNMSHEMRTPMSAIIGMTAIGRKAKDIAQKDHALNKINDASTHLLGVINDVLDMAKIEANKLELAPIEFRFDKMLQNVINVNHFRMDEKRQNLTVDIDKKIPDMLFGDDQRLAQVITNLLSNAVKFTHEGGDIGMEAVLLSENDGVCELRIEVVDNGIGIAQEQHGKLFSMFEQAESGTSREFGGTGLGLVISRNIVELMDGKIWFESELGKGSQFMFTVKVQRCDEGFSVDGSKESLQAESESMSMVVENGSLEGKKLLVAEDVEINREILIALLEHTGIEIECAVNGAEAFEMVAADPEKYDMVFMDVQMPKMDGFESTRRMRSLPECKKGAFPIIAMTANVFKSDIEECLEAGMDEHLGKPLDIDKVLEVLHKYL